MHFCMDEPHVTEHRISSPGLHEDEFAPGFMIDPHRTGEVLSLPGSVDVTLILDRSYFYHVK